MEEIDASEHFLKMLKTGQFKVEKDGTVLSEGVQMVLLPALTFAKLCKEAPPTLLYQIAEYQAEKAIELHSKFFGLSLLKAVSQISKGIMERVLDFMTKSWIVDGWGIFKIEKFDLKERKAILINQTNPVARCYLRDFGKTKKPIDHYFVGLVKTIVSKIFNKEVSCVEEKCIACGDPACVFVIKW